MTPNTDAALANIQLSRLRVQLATTIAEARSHILDIKTNEQWKGKDTDTMKNIAIGSWQEVIRVCEEEGESPSPSPL